MTALASTLQAEGHLNRKGFEWAGLDNSLVPSGVAIQGGKYSCTVEGTFNGASVEFQYSKTGDDYHSIDSTNLTFSAAGTWNIEVARGYIKPVRSGGGASTDLNLFLTPLPSDPA